MVSMAEGAGMQAEEQPDSDETSSSNKRKRPAGLFATPSVSKKQDDEQAQRMADSGFFGDDSEGDGDGDSDNTGPCKLTLREVCQQEFDRFQERFKKHEGERLPAVGAAFVLGRGGAGALPEHGARGSSSSVCAGICCRPREGLQHGRAPHHRVP